MQPVVDLFKVAISLNTPSVATNPVRISGGVVWYCPPILCPPFGGWKPYANVSLDVYVDGVEYGTVTTGSDGSYSAELELSYGKHEITVYYPGSWKDSPAEAKAYVTVLSPKEYQQYQEQNLLLYGLAGVTIPLLVYALLRGLKK